MINSLISLVVPLKYLDQFQKYKAISTFLVRLILFYLFWKLAYYVVWSSSALYELEQNFMLAFASSIVESSVTILELFRDDVVYIEAKRIVRLANSGGVTVSTPCVGLEMLYTFLALIVSYPGKLFKKIGFLFSGLIAIHFINLLRIIALTLISFYAPDLVEFNHKYVFEIVVYSFIFLMFIKWVGMNENKKRQAI